MSGRGSTQGAAAAAAALAQRDGVVSGTNGADRIDLAYTGDPDGDRIDAGDAILPGAQPDDDVVLAGNGNDTVHAYNGDDDVDGGNGNDRLFGQDGDDILRGGNGNDILDGGSGGDTLIGGPGNDNLIGGPGDDLAFGEGGDDRLDLGPGNDTGFGGTGDDEIFGGDDEDLLYGGPGRDFIRGDAGNDTLFGDDGVDTIRGSAGNDSIDGGAQDDDMFGEADRDIFVNLTAGDLADGGEAGDDFDTLDLTSWGRAQINILFDPANRENGTVQLFDPNGNPAGLVTFRNIENIVPCFTPGTTIATPRGEIPVEDLKVGDRVVTRDNGLQTIRWVGRRALNYAELGAAPHLRPVLIEKGALGEGLPERDMLVSPNHRILVASDRTALFFEEHEVLVAAKHVTAARGVRPVDVLGVTYVHFLCDRHEVVLANGAWTESFQPGDLTLGAMGNAQRGEIFELFPELREKNGRAGWRAARRTLRRHEAMLLEFPR